MKKESDRPEKERKLLGFVRNNSKYLLKLVKEILALSKLETGRLEVKESAVNFHDFLQPLVPLSPLRGGVNRQTDTAPY